MAFVETDYSGGYGCQSAALVYGNGRFKTYSDCRESGERGSFESDNAVYYPYPINYVLSKFSIEKGPGNVDRFDTVGLPGIRNLDQFEPPGFRIG